MTQYYITGITPSIRDAGTHKEPKKWLVQDNIAYLVKATSTSGFGFHTPLSKIKITKGEL